MKAHWRRCSPGAVIGALVAAACLLCAPVTGQPGTASGSASTTTGSGSSASGSSTAAGSPSGSASGAAEISLPDLIDKALTAYGGKESLAQSVEQATIHGRQTYADGSTGTFRFVRKMSRWRIDLEKVVPVAAGGAAGADSARAVAGQNADDGAKAGGADSAGDAPKSSPSEKTGDAPAKTAAGPGEKDSKAETETVQETIAFDGRACWKQASGRVVELTAQETKALNDRYWRQPFLLTLFKEPEYKFNFLGKTSYKQLPVYALEVSKGTESATTFFLDRSNYLVVGSSYAGECDGKTKTTSFDYSEYRPAGGTMYAFRQVENQDDTQIVDTAISSFNTSALVEETVFSRPGEKVVHLAQPITVPFDYSHKEIIVKARVNDSDDLDFLLDTGASDTIIDRRIAAQYFLAKQGAYDIAAISGMVSAQSSTLKRLDVNGLIVNDLAVRVLDLTPQSRQLGRTVSGIIGMNVIGKFLVTIDYSKPSVVFADADATLRPKGASVPFIQKQTPFVKVNLNGKEDQVLLVDTGAAFNHLPTSIAQRHIVGDPANVRHFTEGTGLDGRPVQLGTVVIDTLTVGGQPIKGTVFTYPYQARGQKPAASKPGATRDGFFQTANIGILGNPFWQNFTVTVDCKYQRLILQTNPLVKLRAEIETALQTGDAKLVIHRDYRAAELAYQRCLLLADSARDVRTQAKLFGRMGNLKRIMAKDLNRPEHAKAAYQYFVQAQELARKANAPDVEGRILADWSLLYSDNSQNVESKQTMDRAMQLAPQDANVNVNAAVHLYRAKLFPEMQKYVEKALFLEPSNWQALWYQVKLSEQFYDMTRAMATLREILRFYPWSKVAADKLKNLSMMLPALPPQAVQPTPSMIVRPPQGIPPGSSPPVVPFIPGVPYPPPGVIPVRPTSVPPSTTPANTTRPPTGTLYR